MCSGILSEIQKSIRQKDEEMSWVDACCLQIAIKSSKGSRGAESCTFQTRDPNIKKEWIVGKSYKIEEKTRQNAENKQTHDFTIYGKERTPE